MSIFGEEILPSVPNAKHVSQISQRNRSFIFLTFRMHIIGTIGSNYFWDRNPSFTIISQICVGKYLFNNKAFSRHKPLLSHLGAQKSVHFSVGEKTLQVWSIIKAVFINYWEKKFSLSRKRTFFWFTILCKKG